MGTKTVSLADDAYERLKAHKREGESFSDVVRRLTDTVDLEEYYGVLSDESAEELEEAVRERRERFDEERARRRDDIDVVTY
ncbi:MAG: antitoxin VapB family protein [Halobacteriales archaeon]|nr:antitoxin VapB family protein [Halobacteriales archaeon]